MIALAAIVGAHGIGGEVKLKLFARDVGSLRGHATLDAGGRPLTLAAVRDTPKGPIARFAEVLDRDQADALRGVTLGVPRSALPALADGEFYLTDLIGLPARGADGTPLGRVAAVVDYGAGDLVEIEPASGVSFLVPLRAGAADHADGAVVIAAEWVP